MSNEPTLAGNHPGPITDRLPPEMVRVRRGLRVVGWVMIIWAGAAIAMGVIFGRLTPILFYPFVLAMGWRAVAVASSLQETAAEAAAVSLGRAYVQQSWLVLAWIALGIFIAMRNAPYAP